MNKTDEDLTEFLHGAESPRDRALVAVLFARARDVLAGVDARLGNLH